MVIDCLIMQMCCWRVSCCFQYWVCGSAFNFLIFVVFYDLHLSLPRLDFLWVDLGHSNQHPSFFVLKCINYVFWRLSNIFYSEVITIILPGCFYTWIFFMWFLPLQTQKSATCINWFLYKILVTIQINGNVFLHSISPYSLRCCFVDDLFSHTRDTQSSKCSLSFSNTYAMFLIANLCSKIHPCCGVWLTITTRGIKFSCDVLLCFS